MMVENFAYPGLMSFFEKISSIPRPSFHEERIADYLCEFARERGLEYYRDDIHNVFIRKPASEGREREDAILLQGHTDMVCEKNFDVEHDFMNEGIKLYEKDGWLRAKGTTLGADNGVAVAAMLYILDGAEGHLPSHPQIECLFTVSEEVGLEGATCFDYSHVRATRMINLDSADESQIIAGCAGGERSVISFEPDTELLEKANVVTLSVRGLAGGHSGEDINRGRANANKLIGRILLSLSEKFEIKLIDIFGGSKDNAIPRECTAKVAVEETDAFVDAANKLGAVIGGELCHDDSGFELIVSSESVKGVRAATVKSSEKLFFLLGTVQNGIFEMNVNIAGLVEFSRNLGVISTAEGLSKIEVVFFSRSPQMSQIDVSTAQLNAYAKHLGMTHTVSSRYPGWGYAADSKIRETYAQCFEELYKKRPEVLVIHAGLECGVIRQKLPTLDIISCGPVVLDLHSPDEALNIASFERFFTVVKSVIAK